MGMSLDHNELKDSSSFNESLYFAAQLEVKEIEPEQQNGSCLVCFKSQITY